ncbi:MAG: glycerol-3-phosphate 1-O-acyltransferase PlsY [Gammaproteobacteria bacterium]|nr:glycerol-3-phosphate 1-O-acyltransferase PlsY [Gammaproteobacteria bacterium]
MITDIILIVAAYLFGSLSTAVIVSRAMGLPDPRTYGSGNPGATNVLRHGGKKAAAITLAGDALKGVPPTLLAIFLGVEPHIVALVGAAAFIGHLYPVFFGFKGGKGVATAAGVIMCISWPAGLTVLATWLAAAKLSKISSIGALTAAALAPVYMWYFTQSPEYTAMNVVLSVLLWWRHRSNIRNLINGTEGKIKAKD